MSVGGDIKTTLDAYGALSALVSARNYGNVLPQNPTWPNTVFARISTTPTITLGGRNAKTNYRYQVDCRATTKAGAQAVADQVIAALEAATLFTVVLLDDRDWPYDPDVETHRIVLQFSIWHG